MRPTLLLALALSASLACAQATVDLLAPPYTWGGGPDRPTTTVTIAPTGDAPLAATVVANGGDEDYPKLTTQMSPAQDWSRFTRLRARVRVTCDDPEVKSKSLTFVYYDENTLRPDLADHPMTQQCMGHTVPVGKWVEIRDWLIGINRSAVPMMQLFIYEVPPAQAHTYKWEVAQLQLEGVGETALSFDNEVYDKGAMHASAGRAVRSVRANDKLTLNLGANGGIASVGIGARSLGEGDSQPSGLLVRDVTKPEAPVMVGGRFQQTRDGVRQTARVRELGLAVDATYRNAGDYLEIAGSVRDLEARDRAVTVYFAVPVEEGNWRWWDNVAASRDKPAERGEFSYLEPGMGYGLNGMHSKYPLGAITLPGKAGLSLAVRMDEPVVHRIGYSPDARLFYVALDFALVPERTVKGRDLSVAPFRILLYRHDPQWGFRSALQRYYNFFPQFFAGSVPAEKQGGWYVWGDMSETPFALDAGFRFHWGPSGANAVKWDNLSGPLALLYIEAELYQQAMGDYDRAPTLSEALDRSRKIAAGDEAELAKFMKLGYSHYLPGRYEREHSHRESCIAVNRACAASVCYDAEQNPIGGAGQFPWITESKWGVIFPCNLDPDIPGGKGYFAKELYLENGLKEMEEAGARFDGIALDSFGGYSMCARANFRREHFKYSDFPLSFSADEEHLPVVPSFFSSVEFAKDLAATMHARGLVLMANCSWNTTPGWLTFLTPYLDIYGAEAARFEDPEFARAIARLKPCTDLPYDPRPDWEVARNQLFGIFPGHGNKVEVMKQFAPTFQALAKAGWEPITCATAAATGGSPVRVERFGAGDTVYFVLHNPAESEVEATLAIDAVALGLGNAKLSAGPALTLPAQGTVAVKATRG